MVRVDPYESHMFTPKKKEDEEESEESLKY